MGPTSPCHTEKPCVTYGTNRKMFPDEGGFGCWPRTVAQVRVPRCDWLCPQGPRAGKAPAKGCAPGFNSSVS